MKRIISLFAFTIHLAAFAAGIDATNDTELVIYLNRASDEPLRVSYLPEDLDASPPVYTFSRPAYGNRIVVRVPDPTNAAICAWIGGETFKPGDPFGVRLSRDMRAIELTRTYPVFARIPYGYEKGKSDRETIWGGTYTTSGTNKLGKLAMYYATSDVEPNPNMDAQSFDELLANTYTRIRVIRCRVDGQQATQGSLNHRVIYDQYVPTASRSFLCEYDVVGKGEYDIDWTHFDEIFADPIVGGDELPVTQVVYRVCFGEGDFPINTSTNNLPWIDVARRFEVSRTVPTNLVATTRLGKTTFCWDLPTGRGKYADTYTAFRIVATGPTSYDSGLRFRPPHDNGRFKWTSPATLSSGSYTWKVAMYNAKFQTDNWSATSTFTIE